MRNVVVGCIVALPLAAGPALAQQKQVGSLITKAGPVKVEALAGGLEHPWGMAFLPDGRLLVTERAGRLRIMKPDGTLSDPVAGTPKVFAEGQGGLLDVALDPDFERSPYLNLSFAEPGADGTASTAVGRGRFVDGRIEGFKVLFSQEPRLEGSKHFGGRIAFGAEGNLFLTLGERFKFDPAPNPTNHLGAIVRIARDGSIPSGNPFVGSSDAQDAIWSYGHRNVQAAAIDPQSKALWIAEMGPLGCDELNRPEAGRNYGWPLVSWGRHYDGRDIPDPSTRPDLAAAVKRWTPVISPSGMIFYTGDMFPEWRGSAFIGSLSRQSLVRVALDGYGVTGEEILPLEARIRDVEQGPNGALYLLTDKSDGSVWRLTPLK